jgi:osmotically-inducible protein OsmY
MKNDMQIQRDVTAELDRQPSMIAGSIGVEVHHGVVKLAGRVGDPASRDGAQLAAGAVDGVRDVIMDIDVSGTAVASRSPI